MMIVCKFLTGAKIALRVPTMMDDSARMLRKKFVYRSSRDELLVSFKTFS
jgi:hypothetical protein